MAEIYDPVFHREIIIVGGGAAGGAAALGLQGTQVLMLDVGMSQVSRSLPNEPISFFYDDPTKFDSAEKLDAALIGDNFCALRSPDEIDLCLKLKGPEARFVFERPSVIPRDEHESFYSVQSFTKGGLANFWGAGAMRYTSQELRHFPLLQEELDPFFDLLTNHIGISGSSNDDLADYFGSSQGLLPELGLSQLGERFLARYKRYRCFCQSRGIVVGRSRLAVLSEDYRGRRAYKAFGQEFFNAPHEGIYSPSFTIDELVARGKLEYKSGIVVESFKEFGQRVLVFAKDILTDRSVIYSASRLILAAGTLNSSRIVLRSRSDFTTRLPLLDNPVSFLPCIDFSRIGVPLERRSFSGAELTILYKVPDDNCLPIQGSLYNIMGPLRTDILKEFPLSFRGNLAAGLYLCPAIIMLQLFYPDIPHPNNFLQLLSPSGELRLARNGPPPARLEGKLASTLRWMGYGAFKCLTKRPIAGSSIHYAGTLPMRDSPTGLYETDTVGKLSWTARVHIVDAATFPVLPAKNHTLMLMANAARIGTLVAQSVFSERTR